MYKLLELLGTKVVELYMDGKISRISISEEEDEPRIVEAEPLSYLTWDKNGWKHSEDSESTDGLYDIHCGVSYLKVLNLKYGKHKLPLECQDCTLSFDRKTDKINVFAWFVVDYEIIHYGYEDGCRCDTCKIVDGLESDGDLVTDEFDIDLFVKSKY